MRHVYENASLEGHRDSYEATVKETRELLVQFLVSSFRKIKKPVEVGFVPTALGLVATRTIITSQPAVQSARQKTPIS